MKLTKSQLFWKNHIEKWQQSGLTQAEYCKNNGLKKSSLSAQKAYFVKVGILKATPTTNNFISMEAPKSKISIEFLSGAKLTFDTLPDPSWTAKLIGEINAAHT